MGLDMMLYKAERENITLPEYPSHIPHIFGEQQSEDHEKLVREYWKATEHVYDNSTEVAYWRKFNGLHNYFVQEIQNGIDQCQYTEVSKEQLELLVELIEESIIDQCPVPQLEPTSGFFFGSTDIDEYYWHDMRKTLKMLNEILKETDFEKEMIIYHSSW